MIRDYRILYQKVVYRRLVRDNTVQHGWVCRIMLPNNDTNLQVQRNLSWWLLFLLLSLTRGELLLILRVYHSKAGRQRLSREAPPHD